MHYTYVLGSIGNPDVRYTGHTSGHASHRNGAKIGHTSVSEEGMIMNVSLLAILVAVPLIAAFFLFVLLPRIRRHE